MFPVRVIAASLVWLAAATASLAEPATGSIQGTVTGDGGNRIAGVAVTVQNAVTGRRAAATTDAEGRYQIADLAADGEYQVSVSVPGFTMPPSENVTIVPGAILVVNFRLKLTVTGTVVVSAPSPPSERERSTLQQTMSDELVHGLPLAGRNFIPLATLTAGLTGNPNFPNPQGQVYWANNVLVDGASHFSKWRSAPRTFYSGYPLEAIREIQVLTSRFSAEFGESLATVTRAVTKSGTDRFGGSALFFLQHDALNATPVFAPTNPPSDSEQFGFTLGGPLAERTHFFESYEGRRARVKNIVVSPEQSLGAFADDRQDEHLLFFRIDHRQDQQLLMARYNGQFFRWHNEPGGIMLPGSGTAYTNDVHTILATDRMQLSNRLLSEVRAQFARYVDRREDLRPMVFVSRAGYSTEGGLLGSPGFGADPEDTWEAADTFSWASGSHAIRFGGGAKYVRAHNAFLNYGRGAFFFAGSPDQYPQPYLFIQGVAPSADSAHADPRSTSAFGFVQDDWTVRSGFALNLGLRYDVEQVAHVRNYTAPTDANNLQPRIGAVWDPFGSGRTVIRGGAGVYTQQQLLFYINRVQLEGPDGTLTLTLSPDSPLFPRFPNVLTALPPGAVPPRDIQQLDRSFRNPYSIQTSVGVEHLFNPVNVSADYVYLSGRDLMSLIDANAPDSNPKGNQRTVAQADATRPIPPIPGSYRKIVTLGNLGRSWYHALEVKVDRSRGQRLQTMASYTLSRAEDMDNYQLPEDSRNLAAEKGRADTDIRHNLTFGFTWQLPANRRLTRGWSVSGIGSFRSGRPYTQTWGDDSNGTTQNDARPDGRNTLKTDSYQNVDLALTRQFSRRLTTIEVRLEAFDLFNTVNFDEYVGTLSSPLYFKPISAFPKRRVQLATVVRFR